MTEDEQGAYANLFYGTDPIRHRLLGHPDPIQGDVRLEYELASAQIQGPTTGELDERARHWRLLFQLDSRDEANIMWGDVGRLYYCMRADDIAARDWELAWMVLQC